MNVYCTFNLVSLKWPTKMWLFTYSGDENEVLYTCLPNFSDHCTAPRRTASDWWTVDINSSYLIGNRACLFDKFFQISFKNAYKKCVHLHIYFHKIHWKYISIVCQNRVYIKLICKSIIMLPKHSFVTRNGSESIFKTLWFARYINFKVLQ